MFQIHVAMSNSRRLGHRARLGLPACLCIVGLVLSVASPVQAYDSQSDGSDGAFNPQSDVTIHLGLATNGHWRDTPGTDVNGDGMSDGVYDADQWAVVFKYTTIDIPAGVTVTFTNHPKGSPVVWLASGDVNIAGTVTLSGKNGGTAADPPGFAQGGPGGFAGGMRPGADSAAVTAGMGPGGGAIVGGGSIAGGGGFGTAGFGGGSVGGIPYGAPSLLPLIGGSGGAVNTSFSSGGGGGGGGAILIASAGTITVASSGEIKANGGARGSNLSGHGSGGGIRLVADLVTGSGLLQALSGDPLSGAGWGRIRIEGANGLTGQIRPEASHDSPKPLFPDSAAPMLRATMVHNTSVPDDPLGSVMADDVLIGAANNQQVEIHIEAQNVAPGAIVQVRIVPVLASQASFTVLSTPLDGSFAMSTATASANFPVGPSSVFLRAVIP